MANGEIRARVLRILYDFQMQNPQRVLNADELKSKSFPDVAQNFFDVNLIYLRDANLIDGRGEMGRVGPRDVRITKLGIDVVERPERYSQKYSMNFQVLNVGTNYGQVAQAAQGASISQTQTYSSFNDLKSLVKSHDELNDEERKEIETHLSELEKRAQDGSLSKTIIDQSKAALSKYGWLIPPLVQVIAKALGFSVP
jgi:hypothetical protein